jgi:hypothetical protein
MPSLRRRGTSSAIAFGVVLVTISTLTLSETSVRFEQSILNYVFTLFLVVAMPVTLLWVGISAMRGFSRWSVCVLALLLSVPAGLFAIVLAVYLWDIVETGSDSSFEPIAQQPSRGVIYRLYRTNGGATTSFGLVLRKERVLVPGLKLVRNLRRYYPAYEGRFEAVADGRLRLVVEPYGATQEAQSFEFVP